MPATVDEMYRKYSAKETHEEYLFGVIDAMSAVTNLLTDLILSSDDPAETLALDRARRALDVIDPVTRYGRDNKTFRMSEPIVEDYESICTRS